MRATEGQNGLPTSETWTSSMKNFILHLCLRVFLHPASCILQLASNILSSLYPFILHPASCILATCIPVSLHPCIQHPFIPVSLHPASTYRDFISGSWSISLRWFPNEKSSHPQQAAEQGIDFIIVERSGVKTLDDEPCPASKESDAEDILFYI